MRNARKCACCRGDVPLFVKQDKDYQYHLSMQIKGDLLCTSVLLGYPLGIKKNLSQVSISSRIYYCPLCGSLIDVPPKLGAGKECGFCHEATPGHEQTPILDMSYPGFITARITDGNILVLSNLGFHQQNRTGYISNSDKIPISHCLICGRNISVKSRLSLKGDSKV